MYINEHNILIYSEVITDYESEIYPVSLVLTQISLIMKYTFTT